MLLGQRVGALWALFGCYLLLTAGVCSAAFSVLLIKPRVDNSADGDRDHDLAAAADAGGAAGGGGATSVAACGSARFRRWVSRNLDHLSDVLKAGSALPIAISLKVMSLLSVSARTNNVSSVPPPTNKAHH
jgi:hypothetical protein